MADRKTKLELTWIGKENRPRLEPRILLEDPALSYAAKQRVSEDDIFDNMLIQGDNLLALKALEQQFTGKVKCVFIDPPYNTGSAFDHYDDGVEHSIWLGLIRDRLTILRDLLAPDGAIWITIDDNECHYLKVLADEVFGRPNFIANVVWQKAYTSNQTAKHLSNTHDHVLVYARDSSRFTIGKLGRSTDQEATFKNPDNDPRGAWKAENLSAGQFYAAGQFPITGPTGEVFYPPKNRYWRCNEQQYRAWLSDGRITFGIKGTGRPMLKKYLAEMSGGLTANTWWTHDEVGSNKEASIHLKSLLISEPEVFQTPKPEKLVKRIVELTTVPGDLVLDSFAGSGTTGATAHKLGRRWILVELGAHATTQIIPRLRKVIDGEDPGGITSAVNWNGGGGFRFYRLAPSLLERDKWGNWVINRSYNKEMLAEAMCKLHGFTYAPSDAVFWMHGQSTERDYIYVTTQTLTFEQLQALSEEVGAERSLLVCCGAWLGKPDALTNLTVAKIPASVLERCEWGKDDYSLNVANLMGEAAEPPDPAPSPPGGAEEAPAKKRGRKPKSVQEMPLFAPRGEK
jgi:adenine-specific DNA-methyltransferase